MVLPILEETKLDAKVLQLELTETVPMRHVVSTESILNALRAHGVQLAIDDFGIGYTSLSYLKRFPVDELTIDRSFIQQVSGKQTGILAAIISMGRSLGLRVVAEGVETKEELGFLQLHLCHEAQGFYLGRPVAPENLAMLLEPEVAEAIPA